MIGVTFYRVRIPDPAIPLHLSIGFIPDAIMAWQLDADGEAGFEGIFCWAKAHGEFPVIEGGTAGYGGTVLPYAGGDLIDSAGTARSGGVVTDAASYRDRRGQVPAELTRTEEGLTIGLGEHGNSAWQSNYTYLILCFHETN